MGAIERFCYVLFFSRIQIIERKKGVVITIFWIKCCISPTKSLFLIFHMLNYILWEFLSLEPHKKKFGGKGGFSLEKNPQKNFFFGNGRGRLVVVGIFFNSFLTF